MKLPKIRLSEDTWYIILYYILIFSTFLNQAALSFPVPGIGSIYLFRVMLTVMSFFTIYRFYKKKESVKIGNMQKCLLALFAIVGVYGVATLFFAKDFAYTASLLINWIIDGVFVVFLICFNNTPKRLKHTFISVMANTLLMILLGVIESFTGAIFFPEMAAGAERVLFFNFGLNDMIYVYNENSNFVATLVIFGVLLSLIYLMCKIAVNESSNKGNKRYYILCVCLLSLGFYIGVYTLARLTQLALIGVLIFFALFTILFTRKIKRIFMMMAIVFGFLLVKLASNYPVVEVKVENAALYVQSILDKTKQEDTAIVSTDIATEPAKPVYKEEPQVYPNSVVLSKEDFNANSMGSGGIRLNLIKFALKTAVKSHGLGVGMGNTLHLATQDPVLQRNNVFITHCFPIRLIADFGIFALIPMAMYALLLVLNLVKLFIRDFKKSLYHKSFIFFIALAAVILPIGITIPSDAQDYWVMWICLSVLAILLDDTVVLSSEHFED